MCVGFACSIKILCFPCADFCCDGEAEGGHAGNDFVQP